MATKKNSQLEVRLIVDSRESDLYYVNDVLDKRISKDGIKISCYEIKTCKPLGCNISTGDIGIEIREYGTDNEWIPTNFCLELKKRNDLMSSIYSKTNRDRLFNELSRSYEAKLDFTFVSTHSIEEIIKGISKIPRLRNTNAEVGFFDNFIKLQDELNKYGYNYITSGDKALSWVIRRLIKNYIKKHKLQQKIVYMK